MMQRIDRTILVSEVPDRPLLGQSQKGGGRCHVFDKPSVDWFACFGGNAEC